MAADNAHAALSPEHYGSSAHVWQGRFKTFPVQRDEHLITLMRYVLQNPVRAGLSSTAREWRWSSLRRPELVDECPVSYKEQFAELLQEDQLATVRECVSRQRPFGKKEWQARTAATFGSGARCVLVVGREAGRKVACLLYDLFMIFSRMNPVKIGWAKMTWIAACLFFVSLFSHSLYAASDSKIVEGAKKDGELMLWTSSDLQTANRLVERFEQKYSFVKVKVFRTGTGALHNKITTEALAGKHNWDVMNTLMPTRDLIERKLLARYSSPEAGMLLDQSLRDPTGYWTAIYAIPFVLGYNTKLVKPADAPKSYDELLGPQWKGSKISIDQDGYELLQGLFLSWGKEKGLEYLKKLASQQPVARRGNSLRVQLVAAGEYPLIISMASPIQLAHRAGAPIDWIPLEPVPVSFHAIALAEHASHPNAAKLYIDFVLSREGQEALRSVQRIPVRKDVEADPPTLFKGYNRVMLQPMKSEEFNEIMRLYQNVFSLR